MTDLKAIEDVTTKFVSVDALSRELKRVQSVKCRLKKQKGRANYNELMTGTLQYEEVLKEARALLEPRTKPVTQFGQADVDSLDYDETIKAIRSIQSKKTLSRWLTDSDGDNDEYRNATVIEAMLVARRSETAPVDAGHVRKTDVQAIIDTLKESGKLSQTKVIELLEKLV